MKQVGPGSEAEVGPRIRPPQSWLGFCRVTAVFSAVSDGWSGKPSPLLHQLLLLPLCCFVAFLLWQLLRARPATDARHVAPGPWLGRVALWLFCFEGVSIGLMVAEARHFQQFGYHLTVPSAELFLGIVVVFGALITWGRGSLRATLVGVLGVYGAGAVLAIRDFPLNYLRSDMLPVIGWSDSRLLAGLGPYDTMHVGARVYDFPYLPGMLVGFLPAAALHVDLRWANLVYVLALSALLVYMARADERRPAALLLGVFLLCPFLQFRHDLYLQPHWFLLILALCLMQRRSFLGAAFVWGLSCAVYQLSWVLIPFVLLHAFRRDGFRESLKEGVLVCAGFFCVLGPFLKGTMERVGHNTVGQWRSLPHALADPINLSYWVTFVVRPDHLMWVQATLLTGMFGYCVLARRCRSFQDTLRWMAWALALFISLNVLVDGYFYLTLLLLLLVYVCVAEGWWPQADVAGPLGTHSSASLDSFS